MFLCAQEKSIVNPKVSARGDKNDFFTHEKDYASLEDMCLYDKRLKIIHNLPFHDATSIFSFKVFSFETYRAGKREQFRLAGI